MMGCLTRNLSNATCRYNTALIAPGSIETPHNTVSVETAAAAPSGRILRQRTPTGITIENHTNTIVEHRSEVATNTPTQSSSSRTITQSSNKYATDGTGEPSDAESNVASSAVRQTVTRGRNSKGRRKVC